MLEHHICWICVTNSSFETNSIAVNSIVYKDKASTMSFIAFIRPRSQVLIKDLLENEFAAEVETRAKSAEKARKLVIEVPI
jgi:hypothetical protein